MSGTELNKGALLEKFKKGYTKVISNQKNIKKGTLLERYKAGEACSFDEGDKLEKAHFNNIGGELEELHRFRAPKRYRRRR